MTEPAAPPPITPAVTMKAHQLLEARVEALEAQVKELKAFADVARQMIAQQQGTPKKGWNPFE